DQLTLHDFHFAERGVTRYPAMDMTGADVEAALDAQDADDPLPPLDHAMSLIWAQFPSDIVQQSPNLKSSTAAAYIKLSRAEREEVTIDLFKGYYLPFDAAYIRLCQREDWHNLVFDKFFPPKNKQTGERTQNFRQSRYFDDYLRQIRQLSDRDAETVRDRLKSLFRDIVWLPHPYSDRMWSTSKHDLTYGWRVLPEGHTSKAVHLVLNPAF
ncbi:hypothetical protein BD309DRAFT_833076, partial [Dichomitus squalens]